jgi:hypothetical protein
MVMRQPFFAELVDLDRNAVFLPVAGGGARARAALPRRGYGLRDSIGDAVEELWRLAT